ncbi:Rrf2 family transcriptional regulator [Clostridium sp. AL.422]|uniref:RrF2 family transcriptional regulator n=1 Tax=Clostridium TaxID=1485 RepID=UPI00293DA27A|nr:MULTISPECIES: Rrf2 family transcriptional regulator [unclassified Clostridium]MDV4150691.1 Rrf2 family transcriptional regulator [Clostridium sp. AL.422]
MKYTKATNYALHILTYMIKYNEKNNLSLYPLAKHFNISPSYLSKILTKLVKANIIRSTPGVNGGYILYKKKEDITVLDVIEAIEGDSKMFTCEMDEKSECKIQKTMSEAEQIMTNYLRNKKILEII